MTELSKSVFAVNYTNNVDVIEMCFRLIYYADPYYFSGYVCQIINEETGEAGPVVPIPDGEWFGGRIGASKNNPEEVLSLSSFPEGYRSIDLLHSHTWVIQFWKEDSPQKNFTIKQTSNITGVKTSVSVSGDNKTIGDGSTVFKYRAYPDILRVSRVTHDDETLNLNNASSATLEVRHPSNNSLISSHSVYSANMPVRITIPNDLSGVTFNYIITDLVNVTMEVSRDIKCREQSSGNTNTGGIALLSVGVGNEGYFAKGGEPFFTESLNEYITSYDSDGYYEQQEKTVNSEYFWKSNKFFMKLEQGREYFNFKDSLEDSPSRLFLEVDVDFRGSRKISFKKEIEQFASSGNIKEELIFGGDVTEEDLRFIKEGVKPRIRVKWTTIPK